MYNYMVEQATRYSFRTVEMNTEGGGIEHVLVSRSPQNKVYDVSLLAKLHREKEGQSLSLKFFVVMTHRRELFPKMKAEMSHRKDSASVVLESGKKKKTSYDFYAN